MKPDFEELVERHSAEIFAYVWRMQCDRGDAQNCLQGRSYVHFEQTMIQYDEHSGKTVLHGI